MTNLFLTVFFRSKYTKLKTKVISTRSEKAIRYDKEVILDGWGLVANVRDLRWSYAQRTCLRKSTEQIEHNHSLFGWNFEIQPFTELIPTSSLCMFFHVTFLFQTSRKANSLAEVLTRTKSVAYVRTRRVSPSRARTRPNITSCADARPLVGLAFPRERV